MIYKTINPVSIVIFNREDKAAHLYEALKKVQPQKLFIIADGPRNETETEKCERTRRVFEKIEWPCTIIRNYSDTNLGCARRVASGFDWVFQNVEQAILIEDDCIPSVDFFRFCDEMLQRYKNDTRIMQVCGTNLLKQWDTDGDSYFFSQWASCWGWATWARAWKLFDFDIKKWRSKRVKKLLKQNLGNLIYNSKKKSYDEYYFKTVTITEWDRQWEFIRSIYNGLSVTPSVNLVVNIGGGADATHTHDMTSLSIPALPMQFPLRHPICVMPDRAFNLKMVEMVNDIKPLYKKAFRKAKRILLKNNHIS